MPEKLTRVQELIITKILENGGSWTSLSKLSLELGIHYGHSFTCVKRLEDLKLLKVERRAGSPMHMCAAVKLTPFSGKPVTGNR